MGPGRPVPYVPTAALVVRRSALGVGFVPTLRYGEDVDLVWRMGDAGWHARYVPSVTVDHGEPSTWLGLLSRRYRYGTSAAPLARRHRGRLAPAVVRPLPAAAVALALARRPLPAAALSMLSGLAAGPPGGQSGHTVGSGGSLERGGPHCHRGGPRSSRHRRRRTGAGGGGGHQPALPLVGSCPLVGAAHG